MPGDTRDPGELTTGETKTIFYDGELCEAETLPNGFTKIRSKNLDILFKREYYEQRIATQKQLSEELSKNAANNKTLDKETTPGATIPGYNDTENVSEKDMVASNTESDTPTLDKIDPDEIREFKPMNHGLETPLPEMESGQTSPFHLSGYGASYPPTSCDSELTATSEGYLASAAGARAANLYLYSPSNNTLIPCEEIIIPNPVMSPDTGEPVYTGPTNIYLAYPVQGPDGRSYITQPFPMVEGYTGPMAGHGYPGYSHSVSYDSSNYYSSTPHTPNSGEDSGSGSSTQPTSPPPLVNYHPSNWFKPEQSGELGEYGPHYHFSPAPKLGPLSQHTAPEPETVSKTTAPAVTEKVINPSASSDNSSRLNTETPSTITYIPGLPQEQMVQATKTPKKKKKKSKPKVEKCNSEDSSIIFEFDTSSPPAKEEEMSLEASCEPELDTSASSEQVYEIQLTDDLADSLVNPPTDPEISEEESPACDPIEDSIQSNIETEIEISTEPTIKAVTPSSPPAAPDNELVDKEVRDITQMIHSERSQNSLMQNTEDSSDLTVVTKSTAPHDIPDQDGGLASVLKTSDSHSKNEGAKAEKKSKNKKPKKGSKSVLSSRDEKKVTKEEPTTESKVSPSPAPVVSSSEGKKSYSSVIKSSLQQPASVGGTDPVEPVASPEKKSNVIKKENSAEQKAKKKSAEEKKKKKGSIERSDSWENIPVSVTQQEDSWEKTSKKGKKNKRKNEDRKEKVTFEEEVSVEPQPGTVPAKPEPIAEKIPAKETSPEAVITSVEAETETAREETEAEADIEKRKLKRRRKKADSGEPEDAANAHRVLICDEQLQLQYTRELRAVAAAREIGARDVACPRMVEKVTVAGYCDVVYISELGCGINRGAMNFGRLYQGKYVPPERADIVTEAEDEKSEEGDHADQNNAIEEATIEEIVEDDNETGRDADIDLD